MAKEKKTEKVNREVQILGTHEKALTNVFETHTTSQPQIIEEAKSAPGRYDNREGKYE
ncbi:hypothetical protein [Aneurinibacillus tyrosinisolvens]|uniref:hypothetical protein n=1 Tax=Aneurinibacillus tyrosinisolvens TaxID=1443435 RepID=UPI000A4F3144|nr:hypothetical protein [Aneurinibacillus tyrosinisolvens]